MAKKLAIFPFHMRIALCVTFIAKMSNVIMTMKYNQAIDNTCTDNLYVIHMYVLYGIDLV